MSDEQELKPCPFCGLDDEIYLEQGYSLDPNKYPVCRNCASKGLRDYNIESWNNRPIEDALTARIAELEKQLADSKKNINSLCNILESTLRAIDVSGFSSDVFTDFLIEQGVEVSYGTI